MSTQKQDQANRSNGRRGKGRKTAPGKAISAKNSLKHGLLSREVLLPDENAEAYAQFGMRLGEALDPVGELEIILTDRIIGLIWRLRRLGKIEAGILAWQHFRVLNEPNEKEGTKIIVTWRGDRFAQPNEEDVEPRIPYRGYRSQQEAELATAGEAFSAGSGDKDALSRLSRYETSMERSLYKTLHELQRLQAARQGKDVAPPLALDIDVSGAGPRAIDGKVLDLPRSDPD